MERSSGIVNTFQQAQEGSEKQQHISQTYLKAALIDLPVIISYNYIK